MDENKSINHNFIVENRKQFTVSGTLDVISFDEETIVLETSMGRLVIKGDGLKISSFDKSVYDLLGEGKIHAFVYTAQEKSGGFLSRVFR